MLDALRCLHGELSAQRPAALASIVRQHGSTPRGMGAWLVANAQGLMAGSVGGGLPEARTLAACAALCARVDASAPALARLLHMPLDATADLACGGDILLLLEAFAPHAEMLALLEYLLAHGEEGALLVRALPPQAADAAPHCWGCRTADGAWRNAPLPFSGGPSLPGALERAHGLPVGGAAALVTLADVECFVAHLAAPERLFLIGGGHVALATAQLAARTGFDVYVMDNRPEFANKLRFPQAQVRLTPDYADIFASLAIDERDYIVIVTHGHQFDAVAAAQALRTPAGYIGMIGSRRKRQHVDTVLHEQGFDAAALARIHSPVGLPIGADTPEEIAVSIMAECIAHRRGCLAPPTSEGTPTGTPA